MSKYSNFEFENKKTRNEMALEESLKDMKNYKNESQNSNNLDGRYFDDNNFYGLNNPEKYGEAPPNNFCNDPRYTQNQTRNASKKQINIKHNLKILNNISGVDNNKNLGSFEETNYEDSKFTELNRNLDLGINSLKKGIINFDEIQMKENEKKINEENDITKIINKVKNSNEVKSTLKMPKKDIYAKDIKGKILQYKNIPSEIQDMIAQSLISIWKDDFILKKITTYNGVKNFILHNFKDKMNSFFVLFDDEGDFISTFAIDTENFAPYISHLFVNPNLRGKGFGKKSLKYGEKYIKKLGFDSSNLWCEESLVLFYKKNGYTVDSPMKISEDKVVWKMIKNLQ